MAGRPRTPIGAWGKITTTEVREGTWEARAYFRGADGRRRLVSARGPSKAKAERSLKQTLVARSTEVHSPQGSGITPATTINQLCAAWMEQKQKEDIAPQSLGDYQATISGHISQQLGDVTLREATPGRLATFLGSLTPGVRHRARTILVQAFRLARSHDAVPDNPVEGLPVPTQRPPEVKALSPEQLVELRRGVSDWLTGVIDNEGRKLPEPHTPRAWGLGWFVDLLLATGCRPGELAAARWQDVDLHAEPPTLLVAATMVSIPGQGMVRQEWPKSKRGRQLLLPPWAVQTLTEMRAEQHQPAGTAPLIPSAVGTHRDPGNIRKQWRLARKAAGRGQPELWDWVDFRTMRRTVATLIDLASGDEDAAAQLGHSTTAVTRRHYIKARAAQAPDLTAILEQLAG